MTDASRHSAATSQNTGELGPVRRQPNGVPSREAPHLRVGARRRVFVKGMQGADVTVIVWVVQGKVWMSISPPFTWEAIMEPGQVNELMHVLELARDEARKDGDGVD